MFSSITWPAVFSPGFSVNQMSASYWRRDAVPRLFWPSGDVNRRTRQLGVSQRWSIVIPGSGDKNGETKTNGFLLDSRDPNLPNSRKLDQTTGQD